MRMAERFLTGETLKNDIGPKLNLLVERSNREIKGDGRTIAVNEFGNVISISAIGRGGGRGGGASTSGIEGPFAVIKKDDTTVTVCGYNTSEERYFHSYVDIALETPIEVAEQDFTISANAWIYLKITRDTSYLAELGSASSFPAKTNTEEYVRIAFVTFSEGKITEIIQYRFGEISLTGRAL